MTPLSGSEKKQVLHFCALGLDEMQKFVEDLKESIAEVTELEQIRIECKDVVPPRLVSRSRVPWRQTLPAPHLERVQLSKAPPALPTPSPTAPPRLMDGW